MERTNRSCRANAAESTVSLPPPESSAKEDHIPSASLNPNSFASLEAFMLKNRGNSQPLREHAANPSGEMREIHRRHHGKDRHPVMEKLIAQESHCRNTSSDSALIAMRSEVSTLHETTTSSPSTLSPSPTKRHRLTDPQHGTIHHRQEGPHRRKQSRQSTGMVSSKSRNDETRNRRKSTDQPKTVFTTLPAAACKVKSIVGSRPTHWGKISPPQGAIYSTRQKCHEIRKTNRSTDHISLLNSRTAFDAHNLCTNRKQQIRQRIERDLATETAQPGRLSFVPAFASKVERPCIKSTEETIPSGEDSIDGSESRHVDDHVPSSSPVIDVWQPPTLVRSQDPASSVSRRKSKTAAGPFTKRLQYLRQRVNGDAIRLSSGQYPFKVKNDGNDPRNRADSFCDITVLGQPAPWGVRDAQHQNQDYLVVVRGYVHTATDFSTVAMDHPDVTGGRFVWIVLSHRIASEQSLAPGSQLRAYDTVCLGLRDERHTGHVVLCKHLCETYPSSIPPLSPDLSSLLLLSTGNVS